MNVPAVTKSRDRYNQHQLLISQLLLQYIAQIARERQCCKITLEVLNNNTIAKRAYLKHGFAPYTLDDKAGEALFWQKHLS